MKLFISIVIIFCFGYIGKELSLDYFKKSKYLLDFTELVNFIMTNINYTNRDIPDILSKYKFNSISLKSNIEEFVKNFDYKEVNLPKFLEYDEKILYSDFFRRIGKSDKTESLNLLKNISKTSDFFYMRQIQNKKQSGVLPFKLCIYIGLALCILLF